jgi:hypothetical protein
MSSVKTARYSAAVISLKHFNTDFQYNIWLLFTENSLLLLNHLSGYNKGQDNIFRLATAFHSPSLLSDTESVGLNVT